MRVGRVELSPGFLLLMAWLNYLDRQRVVPLALLACTLHELGHCAAIWRFGGGIRRVKLTAVGAEIQLDASLGYIQEGIIALAGPGVNLVLAAWLSKIGLFPVFTGINLVLGCFNLLPLGDFDGSSWSVLIMQSELSMP